MTPLHTSAPLPSAAPGRWNRLLSWAKEWQGLIGLALTIATVLIAGTYGVSQVLDDLEDVGKDVATVKDSLQEEVKRLEDGRAEQETRLIEKIDAQSELVTEKTDRLHERIDGVDKKLDRVDERLDRMDQRMDGFESRLAAQEDAPQVVPASHESRIGT